MKKRIYLPILLVLFLLAMSRCEDATKKEGFDGGTAQNVKTHIEEADSVFLSASSSEQEVAMPLSGVPVSAVQAKSPLIVSVCTPLDDETKRSDCIVRGAEKRTPNLLGSGFSLRSEVVGEDVLKRSLRELHEEAVEKMTEPVVGVQLPSGEGVLRPSERGVRTVIALKTNMLYDLVLAPNIELEVPIGKRWSVNAEYVFPWWLNNKKEFCYQLLSGGIEGRYWLGNRDKRDRLTGHFIGLYAGGGIYDFQYKGDGCQGDFFLTTGLSYGYAKSIARNLSLEFGLGVGYLVTNYRKYTPYEGSLIWKSGGQYNLIGPTKVKISLVWHIKAGGRR